MRLLAPSYLVPGTWLENAEFARGLSWLEGLELLFFRYDEEAREILAREGPGLAALAGRFSFSLHLPDPLGSGDEELIERTRAFTEVYVLHPPQGVGPGETARPEELDRWAKLLDRWRGRHGEIFLLEYTGRQAFGAAEARLPDLPLCADTGRLLLEGEEPRDWIEERLGRIGEIHLHGAVGGKDHMPLAGDEAWLERLAPLLGNYPGRLELEVFSLAGLEDSAAALGRILAATGATSSEGKKK